MRVHPSFIEVKNTISIWPTKNELYLSHSKDLNHLNGAKNLVLVSDDDKRLFLEDKAICCYNMDEMKFFLNLKNFDFIKGKGTYSILGNTKGRMLFLHCYLKNWNFTMLYNSKKIEQCDFIIELDSNQASHKMAWGVKCKLRSKLHDDYIESLNKHNIHKLVPQHMNETFNYNGSLPASGVWVIKCFDIKARGGDGLFIASNEDDIRDVNEQLGNRKAIIQKYITNPTLFKSLKFHFRVWLMVTSWNKYYIYPHWRIVTAKEPYKKDDWLNPDIHDTRFFRTEDDYYVTDFSEFDLGVLKPKMEILCKDIYEALPTQKYDECDYAYQVLGLDVMIEDEKLILLEVNGTPTRKLINYKKELNLRDMTWEMECVREILEL